MPVLRRGRSDRALHRARPRGRDHRLPARLPRPADRQQDRRRRGDPQERGHPAPLRRLADRQLARQAHEREGLRQARSGPGGPGPAAGRRGAAQGRRRRRPAHHRWRRHQHDRGGPRGLPARERLRADGRGPAQDDRQRRDPDPSVARRLDRRRGGCGLRAQHHRRAPLGPAHADRARGHGASLRLADRRLGRRVPQVARPAGVGAEPRAVARACASDRGEREAQAARGADQLGRRSGPRASA